MSIDEALAELTGPGGRYEIRTDEVRGVSLRVYATAPNDLREVWKTAARRTDAVYLVYEDERYTFGDLHRQVCTLAEALAARYGVAPGDRVAIAARNYPEWIVAFWATVVSGAIVVPLNGWWTGEELDYGLADSGSTLLVADGPRLERLGRDRLAERGLVGRTLVMRDPVPAGFDGVDSWETVVGSAPLEELPTSPIEPDDDVSIFYTSGTTGFPKGVVGSHRNMITNLWNMLARAALQKLVAPAPDAAPPVEGEPAARPAALLTVPLFHATGCHGITVPSAFVGQKLVITHKWNPERALELIERERVTTFTGVPTMVKDLLESPDFERRDTSSLRTVGAGGAPTPPDLVARIAREFPKANPSNGYGLTETSSVSTQNLGRDYLDHPDSVGRAAPVVDLQVCDDAGEVLPVGEVGELWIKGPNVVRGYWNKPEATAESFPGGGWFRSGDIARIDADGFVYLLDRAKDIVIRGGENISTVEVEAALHAHPDVMEVAVFGVPHERLGEEVAAAVLPKSGRTVDVDELVAFAGEHLAAFKLPTRVWVLDSSLPRNAAGKIVKRQLRDELIGS